MNNSAQPQSTQPATKGGVEPSDVSFKGIMIFMIGLVITAVLIHVGLGFIFNNLGADAKQEDQRIMQQSMLPSVAASRTHFPPPREQISPQLDLQALRAREEVELNNYGWVDRKNGLVQIPITRAMELISQRGLPEFGGSNAAKSSLQLQQQRATQSSPPNKKEQP